MTAYEFFHLVDSRLQNTEKAGKIKKYESMRHVRAAEVFLMPADILTHIQNEIHAFSKGQKKIASYILTNYDKAALVSRSR